MSKLNQFDPLNFEHLVVKSFGMLTEVISESMNGSPQFFIVNAVMV